jgi:hypothetical protein
MARSQPDRGRAGSQCPTTVTRVLRDTKGGPAGPPRPPPQVRPAHPCRSAPGRPARTGREPAKGRTGAGRNSPNAGGPQGSRASCLAPQPMRAGAPPATRPR